jgi:hypothetical protein
MSDTGSAPSTDDNPTVMTSAGDTAATDGPPDEPEGGGYEWTVTGTTIEMSSGGYDGIVVFDLGDKEVRRALLEVTERRQSGEAPEPEPVAWAEFISGLSPEKLNQLNQILSIEFKGNLPAGVYDELIIQLATGVFKDAQLRPVEIAGSKQLLVRAAELRQSFSQLLKKQRDLDARRREFVVTAYDRLLQASRKILSVLDEGPMKDKKRAQTVGKEDEAQAVLNDVAALIESGVADVIGQEQPDSKLLDNGRKAQTSPLVNQKHKESDRRRKYVVQPNDTLESIAGKQLGDADLALLIYQVNQNVIPLTMVADSKVPALAPGLLLYLPSDAEIVQYKTFVQETNGHGNSETV